VTELEEVGSGVDVRAAVAAARDRLEEAGARDVRAGLILGSGLSSIAEHVEDAVRVPYADLPDFPVSTVEGHAGNFVVGRLEGVPVAFAQGRFHLYEGYSPAEVVLPVRVLIALGAEWLLFTNAAGSLNRRMEPGSLMAIRDHINLQFMNPLVGRSPDAVENPWPDLSRAYDPGLLDRIHEVALVEGIVLRDGVYAAVLGPSYETPAEIRFLKRIGADAVGMSTAPGVIVAAESRIPVAGISLLTNYAAGLSDETLTHADVTEVAGESRDRLERLVRGVLKSPA
jgi:purine-nucleoside phosphorylase